VAYAPPNLVKSISAQTTSISAEAATDQAPAACALMGNEAWQGTLTKIEQENRLLLVTPYLGELSVVAGTVVQDIRDMCEHVSVTCVQSGDQKCLELVQF
jgi:hypothetical protein